MSNIIKNINVSDCVVHLFISNGNSNTSANLLNFSIFAQRSLKTV